MNYRPLALTSAFVLALASCEQKPATSAAPAPAPAPVPAPAAAAPDDVAVAPTPAPAPAPTPAPEPAADAAMDPKATFETALNKLAEDMAAVQKESGGNPLEMMKQLPVILTKLQAVPTAGLPEDIVSAFARLQKNAMDTAEVMKVIPADMPSGQEEVEAYIKDHPEVMAALGGIQTRMEPIQKDGEAAREDLKAAAAKHGVNVSKFLKSGDGGAAGE